MITAIRFLLICVIAAVTTTSTSTDLTLVEGEQGADVVIACLSKLQLSKIFKYDDKIMRRIAYVETRDGLDSTGNETVGGIWNLSFKKYKQTMQVASPLLEKVKQLFGISWKETSFDDLKKPFYSALGARLFLELISESIPLSTDVRAQSRYWKEHYTVSNTSQGEFQQTAYTLNAKEICEVDHLDIFYLLDDSGSVGGEHFNITKQFLYNLTNSFHVSSERVRVGLLAFEYKVRFHFFFNTFVNKTDVLRAIEEIPYNGLGTNTSGALDEARLYGFIESKGMRPASFGVPKIALVVTDGKSYSPNDTKIAAAKLRDTGVIVFAIGIKGANKKELRDMVSKDEYALFTPNFDEDVLNAIQISLSEIICSVSPDMNISEKIDDTLDGKGTQYISYKLEPEGVTIQINVTDGNCSLAVYASTTVRTPNRAFNDFGSVIDKWEDLFINTFSLSNLSNGKTVYLAVQNLKDTSCEVNFSALKGDKSTDPVSVTDLPSTPAKKAGEKLKLECKGYGKPMPDIKWYYQKELLTKKDNNIKENIDVKKGTVLSELFIESVRESNEGLYTCVGSNTMPSGVKKQDQSTIELKVISVLRPPTNVTIFVVSRVNLLVEWSQPEKSNASPVIRYRVHYRITSSTPNVKPSEWLSRETSKDSLYIANVETGQTYEVKVQAKNNDGYGANSTRKSIFVPSAVTNSTTGQDQSKCPQCISIGNLCYAIAFVLGVLAILVIIVALLTLCIVCIAWTLSCSTCNKSTGRKKYDQIKDESDIEGKM